jgi:hypothetical protein
MSGDCSGGGGDCEQQDASLASVTGSTLLRASGGAGTGSGNTESDLIKSCLGELFKATQAPLIRNNCQSEDVEAFAELSSTPRAAADAKPVGVKERWLCC